MGGGLIVEAVVWKKADNVFGFRATEGALSGNGEHRFSNDGKTMTLVGRDMMMGDQKLDDLNDVYTRVGPKKQ